VLDFHSSTDVGRRVPAPVEDDVQSEASEWELRERREREEERRQEAEGQGVEDEEPPLFLPTPSFVASAEEQLERRRRFPLSSLCLSFVVSLVRFHLLGQAWAEELATSRHRADCGQETDSVYFAMISIGRTRVMTKQNKKKLVRSPPRPWSTYAQCVVVEAWFIARRVSAGV
jgi:hypothetical protein